MSVEQQLQPHFAACLTSDDSGCIPAFVDRLMETWADAVREDAEFFLETDLVRPVLQLCTATPNGPATILIDWDAFDDSAPDQPQAVRVRYGVQKNIHHGRLKHGVPAKQPHDWDGRDVDNMALHLEEMRRLARP